MLADWVRLYGIRLFVVVRCLPVLPLAGSAGNPESGVDPTVVSPGAIWIIGAAAGHSYQVRSGRTGPHAPKLAASAARSRGVSLLVVGPLRLRQHLLKHERVDVHHAVLQ